MYGDWQSLRVKAKIFTESQFFENKNMRANVYWALTKC